MLLLSYFAITVISSVIVLFGIPFVSSFIALIFGYYGQYNPILIGLFISIGAGFGSILSQKAGQKFFDTTNKKCSKIKKCFIQFIKKHEKNALPIILISSISLVPESWVFFTIAKDYPKKKIFIINLFTRWLNFFLIAYFGNNYMQKIIEIIKELIT